MLALCVAGSDQPSPVAAPLLACSEPVGNLLFCVFVTFYGVDDFFKGGCSGNRGRSCCVAAPALPTSLCSFSVAQRGQSAVQEVGWHTAFEPPIHYVPSFKLIKCALDSIINEDLLGRSTEMAAGEAAASSPKCQACQLTAAVPATAAMAAAEPNLHLQPCCPRASTPPPTSRDRSHAQTPPEFQQAGARCRGPLALE